MQFSLSFKLQSNILYHFAKDEYSVIDLTKGEPSPVHADITLDDDTDIGYIKGYLLYNDSNFWQLCDVVSGDCETIAAVVCKKDGSVNLRYISCDASYNQIFILDKIEICEECRSKAGIGSTIMKHLPEILQYQFDAGTTVFLCASDYIAAQKFGFDSPQYESGTQRLIRFYQKFGFRIIKDNVMYWKK